MAIFLLIIVIPLLVLSVFLLMGKGAFLIAGYNTMSSENKQVYNEKRLCRFMGCLLLLVCACLMLFPAGDWLGISWLGPAGMVFMAATIFGSLIFVNKSRYFRVPGVAVLTVDPTNKRMTLTGMIFVAVVTIGIGVVVIRGLIEPQVRISDTGLQVTGMYGISIDFSDVREVTLIPQSMAAIGPGQRTNGFAGLGQTMKGNFTTPNYGLTLLFTYSNSSPTIHIAMESRGNRDIFISFSDSSKTEKLYRDIVSAIP